MKLLIDRSALTTAQTNGIAMDALAALATRNFSSSRDALRAILEHITVELGMRTAFLTQLAPGSDHLRVLAAYNTFDGCGITAGMGLPAQPPFADRAIWASAPAPLLVPDIRAEVSLATMMSEFPQIGSYAAAPVLLPGGQLFGALCAADPDPRFPPLEALAVLTVLARLAAGYVELDRVTAARDRAEEALALAQAGQDKPVKGRTAELVAAREQLEDRWRALMVTSPDGIAITDLDNIVLLCNEQLAVLNSAPNPEQLVGHNAFEFVAPEDRSLASINVQRALELGTIRNAEYSMLRQDGTRARGEVSMSVILDGKGRPTGFVYVIRDITARLRADERITRHFDRLAALRNIDMAITVSHDVIVTLNVILYQATTQLGVDAACVLLLDEDAQLLEYGLGRGFRTEAISRASVRLGEGHAGRAALERRMVAVTNLAEAEDFTHAPLLVGEGFVGYYAVPLEAKSQIVGVLEIYHRAPLQPDSEWLDFLEALTGQAAIAIDNARMFADLQRSNFELAQAYDTTLEGWSRALDLRDRETEGHTRRVTELAIKLARAMGVGDADLVHLRRGALLHDIGKMGIPDGILLKPGPLTEDEWRIMKRHPEYARDMLGPIPFLSQALAIPYCHHEKWDGSGYPRGLRGEEIPLAARIFSIVDVWDALRSTREYHAPWPEEQVIAHLAALAGTHFDPDVVEAFLRLRAAGAE